MSPVGTEPDPRRRLPSVEAMLSHPGVDVWIERWGRLAVTDAVRAVLHRYRTAVGEGAASPGVPDVLRATLDELEGDIPSPRPVLNGTGVVLHTNLGRAPLSPSAARAAVRAACRYTALEYDVETGTRGDRYAHCADLLTRLTGSEAALVVNNNAAAVSLIISELARGRDVVVSRGELVEIGGGFRIPDVIERSGGFLAAVGTTNRTRIDDYRRAMTPSTGLLLKVHPSNYRVRGFVEETPIEELVELGRRQGIPVLHDQGSGLLAPPGLTLDLEEPDPRRSSTLGVDLTTWSGDKLLGGPQAGLIHGRADLMRRLGSNPLLRAFRVDKMTLAALDATLRAYLDPGQVLQDIPALRMLTRPDREVRRRAERAHAELASEASHHVQVASLCSVVGGGSAPGLEIPSAGWVVDGPPDLLDRAFRACSTPLIGRVRDGRFTIDFRTILPGEEAEVVRAVTAVLLRRKDEE